MEFVKSTRKESVALEKLNHDTAEVVFSEFFS